MSENIHYRWHAPASKRLVAFLVGGPIFGLLFYSFTWLVGEMPTMLVVILGFAALVYVLVVAQLTWASLHGRDDGCILTDKQLRWYTSQGEYHTVEIDNIRCIRGVKRGRAAGSWYLELKDGTTMWLPFDAIGNIYKLTEALSELNGDIRFETEGVHALAVFSGARNVFKKVK